jgi:hypothetical protein
MRRVWIPVNGNGSRASMTGIASITQRCVPLRNAMLPVHPVCTSVTVMLRADSPCIDAPQCRTRSISTNPGVCSCSSPALRTVIEVRSNGPGRVPDSPVNVIPSRVGFRSRSIVAPDTASSCARV